MSVVHLRHISFWLARFQVLHSPEWRVAAILDSTYLPNPFYNLAQGYQVQAGRRWALHKIRPITGVWSACNTLMTHWCSIFRATEKNVGGDRYEQFVFPSTPVHPSIPSVIVSGDRAFGRHLDHKVGALVMRLVPFIRLRDERELAFLLVLRAGADTDRRYCTVCELGNHFSANAKLADTLILDFPASRTLRNVF